MKTHKTLLPSILTIALSSSVYATNGYFSHGYGAKSKSMAGACVAMVFDAACGATTNPASLVVMGNRLDYGFALFMPSRGFTANEDASPTSITPGSYEDINDWFLIPYWSYNRMLDERNSIGVFVGTNREMNTEYDSAIFRNFSNPLEPSTLAFSPTGIDLIQVSTGITYSRKLTERHSVGITPLLAVQAIEIEGLQPFKPFSLYPDKVTNNGYDISFGGGVRIGWLGKITDKLTLGASYQSKLWMSPFQEYKGLLPEKGHFDIPANYNVGLAFKATPKLTLAFDYQRIEYGSINTMSNASDLVFVPGKTLLGTDDGLGFGWDDMDIFKVGLQWEYSPNLTLRAGYSRANNPFPNTQALFNVLTPVVTTSHYTFGLSTPLSEQVEFNVAFTYAPTEKIDGTLNPGQQTGTIEMDQYEIILSWGIKF